MILYCYYSLRVVVKAVRESRRVSPSREDGRLRETGRGNNFTASLTRYIDCRCRCRSSADDRLRESCDAPRTRRKSGLRSMSPSPLLVSSPEDEYACHRRRFINAFQSRYALIYNHACGKFVSSYVTRSSRRREISRNLRQKPAGSLFV